MIAETELSKKMRALADNGHPSASDLREKADAFDLAVEGYYSEPQTVGVKSFLGAFARARRAWCDASGEPLI